MIQYLHSYHFYIVYTHVLLLYCVETVTLAICFCWIFPLHVDLIQVKLKLYVVNDDEILSYQVLS